MVGRDVPALFGVVARGRTARPRRRPRSRPPCSSSSGRRGRSPGPARCRATLPAQPVTIRSRIAFILAGDQRPEIQAVGPAARDAQPRKNRGHQVVVLHQRRDVTVGRSARMAQEQVQLRVERVQLPVRLAEAALVAELRAVIGHEDHQRVVEQLQLLQRVQQHAHPLVHERHLAQVERFDAAQLLLRRVLLRRAFLRRARHDEVLAFE